MLRNCKGQITSGFFKNLFSIYFDENKGCIFERKTVKNAVRSSATNEHFRFFIKTVDCFTLKRHLYAIIN